MQANGKATSMTGNDKKIIKPKGKMIGTVQANDKTTPMTGNDKKNFKLVGKMTGE